MTPDDNSKNNNNVPDNSQEFGFDKPRPTTQGDTVSLNPQPLPPKSRKKLLIIGSVSIAVLAIVLGGWLYYTSPKKVLADALTKTMSTEDAAFDGKLEVTSKSDTPFKVMVDLKGASDGQISQLDAKAKISVGAVDVNVDASTITAQKEAYVKINNAAKIAETASTMAGEYKTTVDSLLPVIKKYDGKWIKVTNPQKDDEMSKCSAALSEFKLSKADQKRIKKIFQDNQFITTKNNGGSSFSEHHYEVGFAQDPAKKFAKEALKLESLKAVKENCGIDTYVDSLTDTADDVKNNNNVKTKAELWVNRWSHEPTRFKVTLQDKDVDMALNFNLMLGKKTTITVPTNAVTWEALLKDIQDVYIKQLGGSALTPADLDM